MTKIVGAKAEFTILLSEDLNKLVVDMSEVEYCDSSGLSSLLLAFRILQSQEGHIRIAVPQKSVRTLIQISQLDRIILPKNTKFIKPRFSA